MGSSDETKILPATNGNGVSILKKLSPILAVAGSVATTAVVITLCLTSMINAAERKADAALNKIQAQEKITDNLANDLQYIRSRIDAIADKVGAKKQ